MSTTWTKLLAEKRVAIEATSKQELDEIREMIHVNENDARVVGLSAQGRFEFAYNAARQIATLAIRASGYRVISKSGHHYYTFQALTAVDVQFDATATYLDQCRSKRNDFSYDSPITVTDTEADDLINTAKQLRTDVEAWIAATHPVLK